MAKPEAGVEHRGVLVAVLTFAGILTVEYERSWTAAQDLYWKDYLKSGGRGQISARSVGKYTLLEGMAAKSQGRLLTGDEIEPVTGADGSQGWRLTKQGAQDGIVRLQWVTGTFSNRGLHRLMGEAVYADLTGWEFYQKPVYASLALLVLLLFLAVPKDRKRRMVWKHGRRLRGPELVTTAELNAKLGSSKICHPLYLTDDALRRAANVREYDEDDTLRPPTRNCETARSRGRRHSTRVSAAPLSKRQTPPFGEGMYTLPEISITERHSYAEVSKRVPEAVLCLLSALALHEITTQNPASIWIALGKRARTPALESNALRVIRLSGPSLMEGIENHRVEGDSVRVYSIGKTVADCFKFRNKIGLDIAIEALKDCLAQKKASVSDIYRYAKICRVSNVIRPYLEAV